MPEMPGLPGEIYFGDVAAPLPDWRSAPAEEDDDTVTPDDRRRVAGMLGFDPLADRTLEEEE